MSKSLSTEDITELREAWLRATSCFNAKNRVDYWFDRLIKQYSEPHRHYHDIHHVLYLIRYLKAYSNFSRTYESALVLFFFFHDCVYRTEFVKIPAHSERVSAHQARVAMRDMDIAEEFVSYVEQWILASTHKGDVQGDPFALDFDLAILAEEPATYDEYCLNTRKEFSWATDEQWRTGRSAFLKGMLAKDKIYSLVHMGRNLEEKARANMERELARLSAE